MGKILSEQRIAQFNRDGYLYPIPMLSQHEVTRYRQGLAASEAWLGHPIDYPEKMKAHLLFEWMDELVHHPRILDAVEDLMGPDILLFQPTLWVERAEQRRSRALASGLVLFQYRTIRIPHRLGCSFRCIHSSRPV